MSNEDGVGKTKKKLERKVEKLSQKQNKVCKQFLSFLPARAVNQELKVNVSPPVVLTSNHQSPVHNTKTNMTLQSINFIKNSANFLDRLSNKPTPRNLSTDIH